MGVVTLEGVFSACSAMAMLGWAGLVLLPHKRWVVEHATRWVIPGVIGGIYAIVMALHWGQAPSDAGFGSLDAVSRLFSVDGLLLGGWVHYLAFDLFVGSWEVENARQRGVPHGWVIPCLLLTLMAGPAGLLLYLLIRLAFRPAPEAVQAS